jgi:Raf kinase inhibitor-like YbhB/YbcL family protein
MPTVSRRFMLFSTALLAIAALSGCSSDGRTLRPAGPNQTQSVIDVTTTTKATLAAAAELRVTALWSSDGTTIDKGHSCDGEDRAPEVSWTGVPADGAEIALVMVDDDINAVHWIVGGLPAVDGALKSAALPVGSVAGTNDFGDERWHGPCPPVGSTHHYRITLYVLSEEFGLGENLVGKDAVAALRDRAIATAQTRATYTRVN